jgi:hypothetical protein
VIREQNYALGLVVHIIIIVPHTIIVILFFFVSFVVELRIALYYVHNTIEKIQNKRQTLIDIIFSPHCESTSTTRTT